MEDRVKDPCVMVRSTLKTSGTNKRQEPEDRYKFYIGGDAQSGNQFVDTLIDALVAARENDRGVVLDLHVAKKKSDNGREFYSTYFFIKPTADAPTQGAPRTAVAKGQSLATRARVEQVRQNFNADKDIEY